jgi:hypothetical protein
MAKSPQTIDPAALAKMNEGLDKVSGMHPALGGVIDKLRESKLGTKKKGPQTPTVPSTPPDWTAGRLAPEARAQLLAEMMARSKANATPSAAPRPSSKGAQSVPPAGGG